ncbi:MAG: isopenicillin N synthase family oxygenase [Proteobacteria bacterium]|nr:isopenicillin N synthase family oxygenase [Pseudomonadota bacterium]
MLIYSPPDTLTAVPVIDLKGGVGSDVAQRDLIASDIHDACRNIGFFYIVNHGVPAQWVRDQFDWAARFFELPMDEKLPLHMRNSATTAGYEPIAEQRLDSQDTSSEPAPPDLKESYYCGMDLPDTHPFSRRRVRGIGHNQWPAALPGFRDQMVAYHTALRGLSDHLLTLVARSLELEADWFAKFHDWPGSVLRLVRYPPQPETTEFNQIGAGAHTDWGGITLLAQDSIGGLEVQNAADEWVSAPPVEGSFVVNLGDLMSRWTNGVYRSNMHRVLNSDAERDRYSIPFFHSPRFDAVIEPVPSCVNDEQPAKFEPCTTSEHMDEMFRLSYGYEATS